MDPFLVVVFYDSVVVSGQPLLRLEKLVAVGMDIPNSDPHEDMP